MVSDEAAAAQLESMRRQFSDYRYRYESPAEAFVPLRPDSPYLLFEMSKDMYSAIAVFRHTPHHAVIITGTRSGDQMKVVRFDWMPLNPGEARK